MLIRKGAVSAVVALAVALTAAPAPAEQPDARRDAHKRRAAQQPRMAPAARDALTRALDRGRLTQAEYALQRVRSLIDLKRVRRDFGDVKAPDGRHATMLFRDLALRVNELEGAERELADRILARPDDNGGDRFPVGGGQEVVIKWDVAGTHQCSSAPARPICLHWVDDPESPHHADAAQVALTLGVLDEVWASLVEEGGFRAPKPDVKGPPGSESHLDVYLAGLGGIQVGNQQLSIYGYCTSDDPERSVRFDVSAFCVLDNDYAVDQFAGDPEDNLRVSAAHEFFHAVQFAYDWLEDFWLMEGTAAAIEDHVYDDINDNYQFLRTSQLVAPQIPTDRSDQGRDYGSWIFWRFMSEYLAPTDAPDMAVIRQIWERADAAQPEPGSPQPPDDYSLQAAVNVAKSNGIPFRRLFADYGVALQRPEQNFVEGAGYVAFLDAQPGLSRKTTHRAIQLRPGAPRARWAPKVNHLAHKYATIAKNNAGAHRRMRVILDLPPRKRGSIATLLGFRADGKLLREERIPLDGKGDGRITVGRNVRRAVVVLTNASTRFGPCWQFSGLSCDGKPRDNGLVYELKARLLR